MIFQQFRHEEGGCLSYLVGCTRNSVCAVIDPQYDVAPYVRYANAHRMRITHVFETHAQADHISGAKRLAEAAGAKVHYHESAETAFPVVKLRDGDVIELGNVRLGILHTPGHTSDSVSISVTDTTRSDVPWLVLTGDTLFVGDTGRPDLDGDAGKLYDSIWGKLLKFDDSTEVYPTHFAGSSCGKAMSPKPNSTIGFERRFNPSLQARSKEEFVEAVMADLPVQPPRFQKVRQFNLGFLQEPPIERTYDAGSLQVTVQELKRKIDAGEDFVLVDVREPDEYAEANLDGVLIPLRELPKRFSELDPAKETIVHCHTGGRSQRAVEYLYEKGFRNVKNLVGGIDAWSRTIDPRVPRY